MTKTITQNLYLKVSSKDIFTYAEALDDLKRSEPDTLFPATIQPRLLSRYGYELLTVHELNDYNAFKEISFKNLRQDSEGNWVVDVYWMITELTKKLVMNHFRTVRNKALEKVDWVESSDVTAESKRRIFEYKELLRNLPSILESNIELHYQTLANGVLPAVPSIEFNSKVTKSSEELSDEDFELLKYYKASTEEKQKEYDEFLSSWQRFKFDRNSYLVNSLLKLHASMDLDSLTYTENKEENNEETKAVSNVSSSKAKRPIRKPKVQGK